jgi:hypothetical protein
MRIIDDYKFFLTAIEEAVFPGDKIYIATYNMYAGVFYNGGYGNEINNPKFHSETGKMLDRLHEKEGIELNFKICVPALIQCPNDDPKKDNDKTCYCQAGRGFRRKCNAMVHMTKRWPKFNWNFTDESHAKFVLIQHSNDTLDCFGGGMNLSDSELTDLMFHFTNDNHAFDQLKGIYDHINVKPIKEIAHNPRTYNN